MDWVKLAHKRNKWCGVVNMNLWVPQNTGTVWTGCSTTGYSIKSLLHGVWNKRLLKIYTNYII
jgi:hypothetical protein